MRVQDLMTTDVRCCGADDSLADAAQQMWSGDCGALPVVDEHHNLIGIITDRDICMAAWSRNRQLESICVRDAMSREPTACAADDSVQLAQEKMRASRVRRLPVTAGTRLVGLLSLNDLVLEAIGARTSQPARVTGDEVVTTLGRICEHRTPSDRMAAE